MAISTIHGRFDNELQRNKTLNKLRRLFGGNFLYFDEYDLFVVNSLNDKEQRIFLNVLFANSRKRLKEFFRNNKLKKVVN